ncbi:MAG TPA: DUF4365 domain-containing protein [Planctomycetota bacterium]|nr:DUF4365 domain-containing protein [Planctomycetota bacterium]
MDLNRCKEEFSRAYVHAVASAAGYSLYEPFVDDESVDLGFTGRGASDAKQEPRLEAQLKCTTIATTQNSEIRYTLNKIRNYNDLRLSRVQAPRILIVVNVPSDIANWIEQSDEQMIVRRCAYLLSLRGMPQIRNTSSVSVRIPLEQRFTPVALRAIMRRVSMGGLP